MFEALDTSVFNGLALALATLCIMVLATSVIPVLILENVGIPKKITRNLVGLFCLVGFAIWVYGMFYLDLISKFF
ncbi:MULTISPECIES: hypothetical protein [Rossellomorea]|jgi:hypothetical protein|uniref:hypothetical protein n=1 Tax=Rossellomorea TaxID=2837508 RepID=UPI0032220DBB